MIHNQIYKAKFDQLRSALENTKLEQSTEEIKSIILRHSPISSDSESQISQLSQLSGFEDESIHYYQNNHCKMTLERNDHV